MNIRNIAVMTSKFIKQNITTILSTISIIGVPITVGFAISSTPKANKEFKKIQFDSATRDNDRNCLKNIFKTYIPTIISGSVTMYCIYKSNNRALHGEPSLFERFKGAQFSI